MESLFLFCSYFSRNSLLRKSLARSYMTSKMWNDHTMSDHNKCKAHILPFKFNDEVLSRMHPCDVPYNGVKFNSPEHACPYVRRKKWRYCKWAKFLANDTLLIKLLWWFGSVFWRYYVRNPKIENIGNPKSIIINSAKK